MCGELFSDMDGTVYLESSDSDKLWFNSHTQMVMYHLQEDVKWKYGRRMTMKFSFLNMIMLLQVYLLRHHDRCPASFRFYTPSSMPLFPTFQIVCKMKRLMVITIKRTLATFAEFRTQNCNSCYQQGQNDCIWVTGHLGGHWKSANMLKHKEKCSIWKRFDPYSYTDGTLELYRKIHHNVIH